MSGKHLLFIQPLTNFSFPVISLPVRGKTSPRVGPRFNRQHLKCPASRGRSLRSGIFYRVQTLRAEYAQPESVVLKLTQIKVNKAWEAEHEHAQHSQGRHPKSPHRPTGINQVAKGPPCCFLQQVPSGTKLLSSSTRFSLGFCNFLRRVVFLLYPQVVARAHLNQQQPPLCLQPDLSRMALRRRPSRSSVLEPGLSPSSRRQSWPGSWAPQPRVQGF